MVQNMMIVECWSGRIDDTARNCVEMPHILYHRLYSECNTTRYNTILHFRMPGYVRPCCDMPCCTLHTQYSILRCERDVRTFNWTLGNEEVACISLSPSSAIVIYYEP